MGRNCGILFPLLGAEVEAPLISDEFLAISGGSWRNHGQPTTAPEDRAPAPSRG